MQFSTPALAFVKTTLTWLVAGLLLALSGCEMGVRDTSPFAEPPDQQLDQTADPAPAQVPVDDNSAKTPAAHDTPEPPAPPAPPAQPDEPPLTHGWITAPNKHCEDPANQFWAEYVIDGDTLALANGDRVRHIGVDAPELQKNDCWADEARDALMELTPVNTPLCLMADSNAPNKDYWGRLLRYVFLKQGDSWVMQNARLVRVGAARAYHKYLKGMSYANEMTLAETTAHSESQGGWKACNSWD